MNDDYPHRIAMIYCSCEGDLSNNMIWHAQIEDEHINEACDILDGQFGRGMWQFDTSCEYNQRTNTTLIYFEYSFRTESDLIAARIIL